MIQNLDARELDLLLGQRNELNRKIRGLERIVRVMEKENSELKSFKNTVLASRVNVWNEK